MSVQNDYWLMMRSILASNRLRLACIGPRFARALRVELPAELAGPEKGNISDDHHQQDV
jgi:hypothetical protein